MKAKLIGGLVAYLIRLLVGTLRLSVEGVEKMGEGVRIGIFWHDRILIMPYFFRHYFPQEKAAVLTSASKDGEILAHVMKHFGIEAVRGSSSRRGVTALLELVDKLEKGYFVGVTPDGPRGPRHQLQPGVLKLAQKTKKRIFPVQVIYQNAWQLKSWDRFQIPKPFTRVHVKVLDPQEIPAETDDETFAEERIRLEKILLENIPN